MTVHRRDSAPPYEALSYTWGNPKRDKIILCYGKRLRVTKNCKNALLALRARRRAYLQMEDADADRLVQWYVWIDAICID